MLHESYKRIFSLVMLTSIHCVQMLCSLMHFSVYCLDIVTLLGNLTCCFIKFLPYF